MIVPRNQKRCPDINDKYFKKFDTKIGDDLQQNLIHFT